MIVLRCAAASHRELAGSCHRALFSSVSFLCVSVNLILFLLRVWWTVAFTSLVFSDSMALFVVHWAVSVNGHGYDCLLHRLLAVRTGTVCPCVCGNVPVCPLSGCVLGGRLVCPVPLGGDFLCSCLDGDFLCSCLDGDFLCSCLDGDFLCRFTIWQSRQTLGWFLSKLFHTRVP